MDVDRNRDGRARDVESSLADMASIQLRCSKLGLTMGSVCRAQVLRNIQ